jgi:uncharacterized protein YqeY
MNLVDQINQDIITAMKAKNEDRLRALRSIKSAFLLVGAETGNKQISNEAAIQAIQKLAKQRKDSIAIYGEQNRQDLVDKEESELVVLNEFLPKQMDEDAIKATLKTLIAETGATSLKEIGKVMPLAMKTMAGKADGGLISKTLKELLA